MGEWKEETLGNLIDAGFAELQTGPFGTMLNAREYCATGVPVIAVQDIAERRLVHHSMVYVGRETAERLARYRVRRNDIIFGRKGAVDRCALIRKEEADWLQGSDCIRLRFRDSVDSGFVAYQMGDRYHKEWLSQYATGATMPSLNQEVLRLLPVFLPPLEEQARIRNVLSSLDDKIDLLHRQNKTLEAMAETLFRQWFVEEAKQAWVLQTLGNVSMNIRQVVHPENVADDTRYVGLEHIERKHLVLYQYGFASQVTSHKTIFRKGDVLFGKLRPYFHKVCFAPFDGVCSTDILVIRSVDPIYSAYCLFAFFQKDVVDYSDLSSEGTRMPRTSWDILSEYPIALPDEKKLRDFNELAIPMIEKMESNRDQIEALKQIRDGLLPKLMSGEVRVKS